MMGFIIIIAILFSVCEMAFSLVEGIIDFFRKIKKR